MYERWIRYTQKCSQYYTLGCLEMQTQTQPRHSFITCNTQASMCYLTDMLWTVIKWFRFECMRLYASHSRYHQKGHHLTTYILLHTTSQNEGNFFISVRFVEKCSCSKTVFFFKSTNEKIIIKSKFVAKSL